MGCCMSRNSKDSDVVMVASTTQWEDLYPANPVQDVTDYGWRFASTYNEDDYNDVFYNEPETDSDGYYEVESTIEV